MSYPTKLKLFKAWAKAMEQGATVSHPDYGKALAPTARRKRSRKPKRSRRWRRRRSIRKKVANA